ncbi:transcription factor Opi1-domain-containing protein [Mycena olivaceomarginata]|nr:transcription factor Opi1-domain-containing protein [Mycena olivaceomarginata]
MAWTAAWDGGGGSQRREVSSEHLFYLTCAVVRCRRFFAVIMIRRPCALALDARARDSTTRPLQPAWAGAGCLPNLQSSGSSLHSCPLPCRLTVRAQALETLDKYRRAPSAAPPTPSTHAPPRSPSRAPTTTAKKKTLDGSPHEDGAGGGYADGPFDARGDYPRDYGGARGPRSYPDDRDDGVAAREGGENGRGRGKRRYEEEEEEEGEEGEGERAEGRDRREVREREGRDGREGRGEGRVPGWLEATSPFVAPPGPPPPLRREAHDSGGPNGNGVREGDERQVAQRSRWQAVLLEAGGLSAALSDEIRNATHRRADPHPARLIASLHPHPPPGSSLAISTDAPEPELTPDHLRTLAHLRSDIVHTIRQVVGVVSKYAGGALPEPARGRVRGFILDLPKRFSAESSGSGGMSPGAAGAASATGVAAAAGSGGASRRGAGVAGSTRSQRGGGCERGGCGRGGEPGAVGAREPACTLTATASACAQSTRKVLVLATESLDMMRGVTAVVADSLDRADAWVDRLRTVGIQRGMDGLALPDGSGEHGHWAGATPAWTAGAPRSPGRYASTSGARSPAYGSDTRYASGARSPTTYAPSDGRSSTYVSSAPSPAAYASGSGAPSPAFGIGGMNLGSGSSRYPTPAPGGEEERERERDEGRMEVDG